MTKTSIVIPYYNHWELTHQALFDLYSHCRESIYEVVLVNDGSTEIMSYDGLEWWKKNKMLPIRVLDMEENVGFLRASNAGIRKASGDIVVLLSNDVRVQENIITKIEKILEDDPASLIGGRLYTESTGWNKFGDKIFPYVEGWLLATTKDGWKELGGFDEQFAPNDYEDVDLSTTAAHKGFTLCELLYAKVTHIGAQSIGYSSVREELTKKNQKKFEAKWL